MPDLSVICPVCDKDIVIPERAITIAVKRRSETGGKILLSCPECCRVLIPAEDVPTADTELRQWIVEKAETQNWLECIPLLDDIVAKMPSGFVEHHGVRQYRPRRGR